MAKYDSKPWDRMTTQEKKVLSAQLREEMRRLPRAPMSEEEARDLLKALSELDPPGPN